MSSAVVTQVQSDCLIPSWPSLFSFLFFSKSFKPTWVYTRSNGEVASSSKRKTTGSNQAHSSYMSTRNYIITCQQQKFRKKKISSYKHSDRKAVALLNHPYSRDFCLRLKSDWGCLKHKGSIVLGGYGFTVYFFVICTGQNNSGIRMKPDPPETGVKKTQRQK